MTSAIDRLIEMDEQESVKQHERAEFLSLIAAVVEALPDALIVADVQGKIVLLNAKAEFMFGYHRSELIGQPVEKLMPESIRELHAKHREIYNRFDISPHARAMGFGRQLTGVRSDGYAFAADIVLARIVVTKGVYNLASVRCPTPAPSVEDAATKPSRQTEEPNA